MAAGHAEDPRGEESLPARVKLGYALGDHAVNVSLASQSLFLLFFLTEVAGLRPALASLVVLAGRGVDAFTDPAMGRISDLTRWRWGRRRPYFLLGALPFGLTFAFLWRQLPDGMPQAALFAAYAAAYVLHTLSSTVVAVPYMALLPEMALGYQERTAMNIFRAGGAMCGVLLAAVAMQPLVDWLGGGAQGFARAGLVFGVWVALPWLVVHRVSWERPGFARPTALGFWAGVRRLAAHGSYRRLLALFLAGRIALDVAGAMFIFYFAYWLRRPQDFPPTMALLLGTVVASLPLWMRVSRHVDKRTLFIFGACWWIGVQGILAWLQPDWPRWTMFVVGALAGVGYGITDLIPWSMLGDVIDEDELATGERREGIYAGSFTFVRKLGGATGVALAAFLAWRYPLSRARHREIVERLQARAAAATNP
jgi:Na+/melibiose symporter-like transporter